ncbi:MAG: hypothetical protein AAF790_09155 [Planctomycetota bacterium]
MPAYTPGPSLASPSPQRPSPQRPSPRTPEQARDEARLYKIDRGPNWLIVHLQTPSGGDHRLTDDLWSICDRHFTYRLVVEMDEVASLSPETNQQLDDLRERLGQRGGALRLCGLSAACERRLDASHGALPNHRTRRDAVLSSDTHTAVNPAPRKPH